MKNFFEIEIENKCKTSIFDPDFDSDFDFDPEGEISEAIKAYGNDIDG